MVMIDGDNKGQDYEIDGCFDEIECLILIFQEVGCQSQMKKMDKEIRMFATAKLL